MEFAMSKVAAILRAHELARQQKVRRPKTQVETLSADQESAYDWAMFQHDCAMDEFNDIPDPLGKTGDREPKSIYDPAPQARISFQKPRKRKGRDPFNLSEHCELPDYRRHQTFTIEDASGRARGVIQINPFSKRINVGGFGLSSRSK
jgi:hypothetical protein